MPRPCSFQLDQINTESRVFHVAWLNCRIDDVAGYLAIAVQIDQKKFKIQFDRNSCPLLEISSKMHRSPRHTLGHWYAQRIFCWAAWVRNRFCFIERAMRSQLLSEISRSGRRRWLEGDEMPLTRAITYKLMDAGLISSVVVTWPGSRRGRRLIDGDSLDSYLESLTAKQALAEVKRNEAT
jgi:hypothetical protein